MINRMRIVLIIGMLLLVGLVVQSESSSVPAENLDADLRILFIGNSYTHDNNLPKLVAETLLAMPQYNSIQTAMVAPGGYRIVQHTEDALDKQDTDLRHYLVTGSPEMRAWDLVVLQGQSRIMGFPIQWKAKRELRQELPRLAKAIRANESTLMFFMTWGYAYGDPSFPEIYDTYLEMQEQVQWGYDGTRQDLLQDDGIMSFVSPIGLAWQTVYMDEVNAGRDPLADLSPFMRLYATDLQHPNLAGSYLTANVIVASYTGEHVTDNSFVPVRLSREYADYLRDVADRVVFEDYQDRDYPFK